MATFKTSDQYLPTGDQPGAIATLGEGLAGSLAVTPRFGRLLVWSLDAAAINDFLQAGFVALTEKANELEERAEA